MVAWGDVLIVGIDASNLLQGGGRTHLIELISAAEPQRQGVKQVVVWGSQATLDALPVRYWLVKIWRPVLEKGPLRRAFWQRFELPKSARTEAIDLLFVPGGSTGTGFRPVVTMSRNMLPFEWQELRRYGVSLTGLRLLMLRYAQSQSFKTADGVIFLTNYARQRVQAITGPLHGSIATIPHGISPVFFETPRVSKKVAQMGSGFPVRLIYVSIVNWYKHQWHVVDAVHQLRALGWNLTLDLVGPCYGPAQRRLDAALERFDPQRTWVMVHGAVPYKYLHSLYQQADVGIFASSCENMPNILLETMAAGLPVACSNRGPMPEIMGDAGVYFDPEKPADIAACLRQLLESMDLSAKLAIASHRKAQQYTWTRCADETFGFLAKIASVAKGKLS